MVGEQPSFERWVTSLVDAMPEDSFSMKPLVTSLCELLS